MDLCFELATQLLKPLGGSVKVVDEVQGFRYFDMRSMVGFVDGTENPEGREAVDFTLIGDEDPSFCNGSYVLVQKYLHNMTAWNELTVEAQERIIGRTKLSDIELDESVKPSCSHSSLTTLEENGEEVKILRDNMPFGRPGAGEFGTYFIGYARSPRPVEQMLENMFVGRRRATTTACWTSVPRSPAGCSSCPPPICWNSWPSARRPASNRKTPARCCGPGFQALHTPPQ